MISSPPRVKAITLKDIAAQCGFSKQTVSRALLNDPRISEATTRKIQAIAGEMGYDPSHNAAARRMVLSKNGRSVRNGTVAFYTTTSSTRYHMSLIWGIWEELARHDHILVLIHSHNPETRERLPLPPIFKSGDIDGTIMYETEYWVEQMVDEMYREPNYGRRPIINILYPMPGATAVLPNYHAGALASADHLFDLGHRHIMHFYTGKDDSTGYPYLQRLLGYQDACRRRGLDPDQCYYPHFNKRLLEWTHDQGIDEFLAVLRAHPEITAVLARHDLEALKIIRALAAVGMRVPEDISVVGFDDTDALYDRGGENRLTSVRLPLVEIGRTAVRQVLSEINENSLRETQIVLPVELVVRGTTAAPKSKL